MDCLNSFNVRINQLKTLTSGTSLKTWTVGTDGYFTIEIPDDSFIDIEGFKNVDIYGCSVVGNVRAVANSLTGGAVVNNWGFNVFFVGNLPLIGAKVSTTTNFYNIVLGGSQAKGFNLSKNTNEIFFNDPITSVKQIYWEAFQVDGFGVQTPGTIVLEYDFNFTFRYKYQEE
jgi:hypothetical protein